MTFLKPKPVATHDFYGPIHKGLRLALSQMLVRLGATDPGDDAAVALLLEDLRAQLRFSEHHLDNEDRHVHLALEARAPGCSARLVQAHEHHRGTFEELEALAAEIDHAPAGERPRLMRRLYLRYSEFVAADFAHMAEEEQVILPVLQSLFTDEELQAIEDRILSEHTPEEMIFAGRLLIPAGTPRERIALLGAVRANAPAEAFAAILELAARPALSEADWAHLAEGLGLAD